MKLLSQNIKNLVQGISQQPPILRFPEQLEAQINGFSTEVDGLQKRVPSVHIKTLSTALKSGDKPLIHYINRDESEKRIAALLTPEQTTTYQKMQEERQKRMEERRAEMQKRLDDGNSWF